MLYVCFPDKNVELRKTVVPPVATELPEEIISLMFAEDPEISIVWSSQLKCTIPTRADTLKQLAYFTSSYFLKERKA